MKRIIIVLSIIALTILVIQYLKGGSDDWTVTVNDFSKPQTFNLTTSQEPSFWNGQYVVGVFITVKGEIEGNVGISGGNCGGKLTGKIDTIFRNDWYVPNASLFVEPLGQVKGELKITFRFSKI